MASRTGPRLTWNSSANSCSPMRSPGASTPARIASRKRSVTKSGKDVRAGNAQIAASLAASKKKLFDLRAKRPHPHLDDKIITAWNGLMISAFARGARWRQCLFVQNRLFVGRRRRIALPEGALAGEQFVEQQSERVHVDAGSDRRATDLLG